MTGPEAYHSRVDGVDSMSIGSTWIQRPGGWVCTFENLYIGHWSVYQFT